MDECGVVQNQSRTHGRAVRGQRVYGLIQGKRTSRINVVAGYCDGEILGDLCYTGSMNATRFEDWFCTHLLPLLKPKDVVIMDNASYHRKKHLIRIAKAHGVIVLFLPTYSPDFNKIEKIWANMKRWIRNYSDQRTTTMNYIYWYFEYR